MFATRSSRGCARCHRTETGASGKELHDEARSKSDLLPTACSTDTLTSPKRAERRVKRRAGTSGHDDQDAGLKVWRPKTHRMADSAGAAVETSLEWRGRQDTEGSSTSSIDPSEVEEGDSTVLGRPNTSSDALALDSPEGAPPPLFPDTRGSGQRGVVPDDSRYHGAAGRNKTPIGVTWS